MTVEIIFEYLLSENWPSFIYEPWDLRHALAVTSLSFAFIPYARKRAHQATPKYRRKAFASKFAVSPEAIQQFESQYRVLPLEQAFVNYEKQQAAWSVSQRLERMAKTAEDMGKALAFKAGNTGNADAKDNSKGNVESSQTGAGSGTVGKKINPATSTPAGADAYEKLAAEGKFGYPGQFSSIMPAPEAVGSGSELPTGEAGAAEAATAQARQAQSASTSSSSGASDGSAVGEATLNFDTGVVIDSGLHTALSKRRCKDPLVALATYITNQRALERYRTKFSGRDFDLQTPRINYFSHGVATPLPWGQIYYFSILAPWLALGVLGYYSLENQKEKVERKEEKRFVGDAAWDDAKMSKAEKRLIDEEPELYMAIQYVKQLRAPRIRANAFSKKGLEINRYFTDYNVDRIQSKVMKPLPDDHPLDQQMQALMKSLINSAPKNLRTDKWLQSTKLDIVDAPQAQAFANLARVHLLTGNFARIMSQDGIAYMLAHELSHVALRHPQEQASGMAMLQVPFNGAWFAAISYMCSKARTAYWRRGVLALVAGFWFRNRFLEMGERMGISQTNECEADVLGLSITTEAGYCPALAVLSGAANFDTLHLSECLAPEPDLQGRMIRAQLAIADGKTPNWYRHVILDDKIASRLPGASRVGPPPIHNARTTVAICNKHVKLAMDKMSKDEVFVKYIQKVYGMSPDMFFEKYGFACENGVNHCDYKLFGESYEQDSVSFLSEYAVRGDKAMTHDMDLVRRGIDPTTKQKRQVKRVDISDADNLVWGLKFISGDESYVNKLFNTHPEMADRTILRCAAATAEMQRVLDLSSKQFERRMRLKRDREKHVLPRPAPGESVDDYWPNTLEDWCARIALGEVQVTRQKIQEQRAGMLEPAGSIGGKNEGQRVMVREGQLVFGEME